MMLKFEPARLEVVKKRGSPLYSLAMVRTIGGRDYLDPINGTFDEFLANHVKRTFGRTWHGHQKRKASGERHVVYDWLVSFGDQTQGPAELTTTAQVSVRGANMSTPVTRHTVQSTHATWELLLLGWDIVCVQHVTTIPECLLDELRSFRTYQPARYTLAVAAINARAGFAIELPDATRSSTSRFDVLVRPPGLDQPLGAEAKTRVRAGVLHGRSGGARSDTGWIRDRLKDATDQHTAGPPLLVFLDLNSPQPADEKGINRAIERKELVIAREFAAVTVTNFAYHYGPFHNNRHWFMFWAPKPSDTLCEPVFRPLVVALEAYGKDIPKELGSDEPRERI